MRVRISLLTLVCLALFGACSSDAGSGPQASPRIDLPLHVHVLESRIDALRSAATDDDIQALLLRTNQIWEAGGIRFALHAITHEALLREDEIEAAIASGTLTAQLLQSALPADLLSDGGWDAFLVDDLTAVAGAPGIYFGGIPALIASEVDPAGVGDPGRILAHELGHGLSLQHVPCPAEGNLMAPGCPGADRGRLTAAQIAAARAVASTGRPVSF